MIILSSYNNLVSGFISLFLGVNLVWAEAGAVEIKSMAPATTFKKYLSNFIMLILSSYNNLVLGFISLLREVDSILAEAGAVEIKEAPAT